MVQTAKDWLAKEVCPLWLNQGFDSKNGFFQECLSLAGEPIPGTPRRLMVQSRQIFSFRLASELGTCDKNQIKDLVKKSASTLLNQYSLPSGGFVHSVDEAGLPSDTKTDLYAQAFALFGLANAYALDPQASYKARALKLIDYLNAERRAEGGGYSEVSSKGISYESNPHMHLFEAAIAWMQIDKDPAWNKLATEILDLCLNKFIDPKTGLLAEYFDAGWKIRTQEGRFIFEPGHQYEWSWLMGHYQMLTGQDLTKMRLQLFNQSEKYGVDANEKMVIDEVWSDLTPKSTTSRFWPQTERIKTAIQLAQMSSGTEQARFTQAADDGMNALFRFFQTPKKGLWYDKLSDGQFLHQPAKGSSLYHIIAALFDYIKVRGELKK